MKLRVIQLINNFFRDKDCGNEDREKALGTYCTFGYFDALHVEESKDFFDTEENMICKKLDTLAVDMLDGTCSRRNLVCIANDSEKDKKFWDLAKESPYLFVSLIRVKHDINSIKVMEQVVDDNRNNSMVITYYSYNHSELVVAKLDNCYAHGMAFVLGLRKQLNILNMYSIFSVREDILKSKDALINKIESEDVSVRLQVMIKNDENVAHFLQELWDILFQEEIQQSNKLQKEDFKKYYTLGSTDLVVEIECVKMCNLLSCYGMGSILTHTNKYFEEAVYNIETEILIKGECIKDGKSVDNGEVNKT